jgi:hypothetical protein
MQTDEAAERARAMGAELQRLRALKDEQDAELTALCRAHGVSAWTDVPDEVGEALDAAFDHVAPRPAPDVTRPRPRGPSFLRA